jgi:hypothetical protein
MPRNSPHNRRWLAWILTIALLAASVVSNASWQCLDGKLCPSGCPMFRAASSHCSACAPKAERCPMCRPPVSLAPAAGSRVACTSASCVLRISERPAARLQGALQIVPALLPQPPPVVAELEPSAAPVVVPAEQDVFPERSLRPSSGRSPPVSSL